MHPGRALCSKVKRSQTIAFPSPPGASFTWLVGIPGNDQADKATKTTCPYFYPLTQPLSVVVRSENSVAPGVGQQKVITPCNCPLTANCLLIESADFSNVRHRFYQVFNSQDVFKTVKADVISDFLKVAAHIYEERFNHLK